MSWWRSPWRLLLLWECLLVGQPPLAEAEQPALAPQELDEEGKVLATGSVMFFARPSTSDELKGEDDFLDSFQHIETRIKQLLDRRHLKAAVGFLQSVQEVWVAPTLSSMEAALQIMGYVHSKVADFPTFKVKAALRPIDSAFQLEGEDLWDSSTGLQFSLRRAARQLASDYFEQAEALDEEVVKLEESWEASRTDFARTRPSSAAAVFANLRSLRADLAGTGGAPVLMIGDKWVGTWLFMSGLPHARSRPPAPGSSDSAVSGEETVLEEVEQPEINLRSLARSRVMGFAHTGVGMANWRVTSASKPLPYFETFSIETNTYDPDLPNIEPYHFVRLGAATKDSGAPPASETTIPFDEGVPLRSEAVAHGLLPADSEWQTFMMRKARLSSGGKKKPGSLRWDTRMVSIAKGTSDGGTKLGYITWRNEFGVPVGFVSVTEVLIKKLHTGGIFIQSREENEYLFQSLESASSDVEDAFLAAYKEAKRWVFSA